MLSQKTRDKIKIRKEHYVGGPLKARYTIICYTAPAYTELMKSYFLNDMEIKITRSADGSHRYYIEIIDPDTPDSDLIYMFKQIAGE